MKNVTSTIYKSITAIDRSDWDQLLGETPEGYAFYQTLEASRFEEFRFYYVGIYQEKRLRLVAPLFTADFDLAIAVDGPLQKLIKALRTILPRFLRTKTLFCGSPFGENGIIGISPSDEDKNELMTELILAMEGLCSSQRIPFMMFKDFLDADTHLFDALKSKGFFEAESFPTVVVPLPFTSTEDYLKSLGPNTRKDLRRKVKKAESQSTISVTVLDSVENILNEVFALYLNTYNAGTVRFEKLTPEFFLSVSRYMPGQAKFFLYYVEGKLAAFNLCLLTNNILIDKFIGFDYAVSRRNNLYFYSWYYNIDWCIKNAVTAYQVGQTDYQAKIYMGGELIPLHVYVRNNNGILNALFRAISKALTPASNDVNLKSNE